jgi:predicted ATPase/DNA-binding CsgD family transcriptional regulator
MLAQSLHNVPGQLTSLIGREQDLERVAQFVVSGDHRLVTVTGVGGCGKTRLALALGEHLAASFPDGVWFVPLDSISDESLIAQTLAAALGLSEAGGQPLREAVTRFLQGRSALLILDNCEHLIAATALVATELLTACPNLHVLATSREPLQLTGERQYRLNPLRVPERAGFAVSVEARAFPAVELFIERAQAIAPDFELTPENVASVAAICARLDGIPLGIELAAAWANSLSVAEIQSRLVDYFRLLRGVNRSRPTRQQTMQAALDWSYDLLAADERALFRQLAVFSGGFDLESVEGAFGSSSLASETGDDSQPFDVAQIMMQLIDKSLVSTSSGPFAMRHRLLEPVRQYALQALTAQQEAVGARSRHAHYFLEVAEQAEPHLHGTDQYVWLDRLEQDESNLRAALQWFIDEGDTEAALRLSIALSPFWKARDRLTEGRRWIASALGASGTSGAVPAVLTATALRVAGHLAYLQYDFDAAGALHRQGLLLSRDVNDELGIAAFLSELSLIAAFMGNHDEAAELADESVRLARSLGDPATLAYALLARGNAAQELGDSDAARPVLIEGLKIYQDLGDARHGAVINTLLGSVALKDADPTTAASHLRDALIAHHCIGNRWFVIYDLLLLASALAALGQPRRAARILGASESLGSDLGEVLSPVGGSAARALALALTSRLGEAQFEATRSEGYAFSRDVAVADALDALETHEDVVPEPRRHHRPHALTRRELEVAHLIARGYTDREIAESLFITTGTVGVHVHNILRKLDLRSRWQVAGRLESQWQPGSGRPD